MAHGQPTVGPSQPPSLLNPQATSSTHEKNSVLQVSSRLHTPNPIQQQPLMRYPLYQDQQRQTPYSGGILLDAELRGRKRITSHSKPALQTRTLQHTPNPTVSA
ncbi:predicted protein [Plenodomus lingam JN3]|uniref:Predicted protein n=1 Tax=Leptosphaeria maculans (strain JN3 / isolate v23.1.3 / race Av1-4-5-6-7-8) TaxID=985895 RepID=E5ADL1_LEPMJ|nr:predicted protein [Plenodomus lingam JN3]CBY01300.1 predicted protein [Plenodomus lingam JN3]